MTRPTGVAIGQSLWPQRMNAVPLAAALLPFAHSMHGTLPKGSGSCQQAALCREQYERGTLWWTVRH